MDIPLDSLQPAAGAAPSEPVAPAAGADQFSPEELLKIPAVKELVDGHIPAVYITAGSVGGPEALAAQIQPAKEVLPKLNLALFQAPKTGALVFYNPKETSEGVLANADQNGTLDDIAVGLGDPQHHLPGSAAAPQAAPQVNPQVDLASANAPVDKARAAASLPLPPTRTKYPAQGIVNDLSARPI